MKTEPLTVLSIAGVDPSCGAGCTADLKVFAAHALYGVMCPTALTVQSTQGVESVQAVDRGLVRATLACLAADIPIAGVKIGMLADRDVVETVADWLEAYRRQHASAPVVLDPVLVSSSGMALLAEDAVEVLVERLLPLATAVTPNRAEAARLSGMVIPDREAAPAAAGSIRRHMGPGAEAGAGAVIITGGHFGRSGTPEDFLLSAAGGDGEWIPGQWVHTRNTHGTGCAYSSALLCALVEGYSMAQAARRAKAYVQEALASSHPVGQGRGPLHHLYRFNERF